MGDPETFTQRFLNDATAQIVSTDAAAQTWLTDAPAQIGWANPRRNLWHFRQCYPPPGTDVQNGMSGPKNLPCLVQRIRCKPTTPELNDVMERSVSSCIPTSSQTGVSQFLELSSHHELSRITWLDPDRRVSPYFLWLPSREKYQSHIPTDECFRLRSANAQITGREEAHGDSRPKGSLDYVHMSIVEPYFLK
jgi:hypothetical protein